jgi:flagellar M-ring protein FliF
MATTTANFTPALATGGSNSTALATTGGAGSNAGSALATFTPGMDVQQGNNYGNGFGGGSGGGPLASVQKMMQQPSVKKAMPLILMGLAVLLFGIIYIWINMPSYRPLMVNMSEADQQTAMEALKASEFKPLLDPSSGQITVPSNKYHEARIFLASKGLPKPLATWALSLSKDQSAMTTSQFMEQVRYTAAMERELARTITRN